MQINRELEEIWAKTYKYIKDNIQEPEILSTFFKPLFINRYDKDKKSVFIKLPSIYYYEHIEAHYAKLLKSALEKVLGPGIKINYEVPQPVKKKGNKSKILLGHTDQIPENAPLTVPPNYAETIKNPFVIPGIKKVQLDSNLNKELSFEDFVVGKNNEYAYIAGKEVVNNPGHKFNPLFIYGNSGLGKTHLVHAIGIAIKQANPRLKVLYVNASAFKDQYSTHVLNNKRLDFLYFYRQMDVLIVDDLQVWENAAGTQSIFFDIFNDLLLHNKQLIFTADKMPSDLKKMDERIISRFKSGLEVEILPPDYEMRVKLLKHKAEKDGLKLDKTIIDYIAQEITSNIREMKGVLVSLQFQAINLKKEITLELAKEVVEKLTIKYKRDISVDKIAELVAKYYNIPKEKLSEKTRKRDIVQARQISMYLAKKYTKTSLSTIGRKIGNKDHSTVLHSYKVVSDLLKTNKKFKLELEEIEDLIRRN